MFDFGGESPAIAAADELARLLRTEVSRLPNDTCADCPLALQILIASFQGSLVPATEGAESVLINGGDAGLPTDAELDEFSAQLGSAVTAGLADVRNYPCSWALSPPLMSFPLHSPYDYTATRHAVASEEPHMRHGYTRRKFACLDRHPCCAVRDVQ